MLVGVPKEIKTDEFRVGLTASSVRQLVHHGHRILVEAGAGLGVGIDDAAYRAAGAEVVEGAGDVFRRADLVVKVKEPQPQECRMLRPGQILFTYLHLAPDPLQAKALLESECVAIAYETITDDKGGLPLLTPMSEVAGRMAIQAGAHALEITQQGRGVLLGGVPGVAPAEVVILGGGVVGNNAARMATGLGASVMVIDKSLARLQELDQQFGTRIRTALATIDAIEANARMADLLIGAVLIPGASAPRLVSRELVSEMKRGAVVVDVAIDQGGCIETSRPTTLANPTYVVDGVVHYCVANMPGAVPRTSTFALNNATLPFVLAIANKGYRKAMQDDWHLMNGLNVHRGRVSHSAVAQALGLECAPAAGVLAS